jgi:acylphosphatase
MGDIRVHLVITGRVQGVFFRESTRHKADSLGLTGWVRNRPDGTVEAVAEGPEKDVRALVAWCHHGPPAARVDRVAQTPEATTGAFGSFEVTY